MALCVPFSLGEPPVACQRQARSLPVHRKLVGRECLLPTATAYNVQAQWSLEELKCSLGTYVARLSLLSAELGEGAFIFIK